jgi:beta-aspartyl-peptidase (threonine type)
MYLMKGYWMILMIQILFFYSCSKQQQPAGNPGENPVLVIHGGAGVIVRSEITAEREQAYMEKLREALQAGFTMLQHNHSALDAVQAAINIMEDSPLFNAGKGAVFADNGKNEMDAAIMNGKTSQAGAVAAVSHIKNPINLARLVMERTPHVLLCGAGAEEFAQQQGMPMMPEEYFFTEHRWQQFLQAREKTKPVPDSLAGNKFGTVGAVALDKAGNLAAGTSTGGLTYKKTGRIGDTPLIGAGTYADNRTCAVSATGQGEYFMRGVIAYDIAAMIEYREISLAEAVHEAIDVKLTAKGGTGGAIALDRNGHIAIAFNTAGMYRGYIKNNEAPFVLIYKE